MRVLVVLRDRPQDEEVVAAAQHLLHRRDEVRLLMVLSPSSVRETVSTDGASCALDPSSVPTATGLLMPAQSPRRLPAESQLQATERVHAQAHATLRRYAAGFPGGTDVGVEVRVASSLVDAVLETAATYRAHGIAIGEARDRRFSAWFGRDPVREIVRRADVPVLLLHGDVHVPRPAPVSVVDASAVLAL